MITLSIFVLRIKVLIYLAIAVSLLFAIGCAKKDQCNTCTVITTNSNSGQSTKTHKESDSGDCSMAFDEYENYIDLEASLADYNAELLDFSGNTTQTHTINCTGN